MGYERLTVAVPGGEIFATRRGAGPAAIFLHGGPGVGAESIIGLVEELDGLVNGVLPQQRGLFPSTLEGPRDVETHVADEIALLDHLGWERAWLIGHSWGGHLLFHGGPVPLRRVPVCRLDGRRAARKGQEHVGQPSREQRALDLDSDRVTRRMARGSNNQPLACNREMAVEYAGQQVQFLVNIVQVTQLR